MSRLRGTLQRFRSEHPMAFVAVSVSLACVAFAIPMVFVVWVMLQRDWLGLLRALCGL